MGESLGAATKPFLSWCLIVRNCEKTLDTCLRSIRDRTPDAEVVIVDTCSSDGGMTVDIARKYADVFEVYKGPRGDWDEKMAAFDDAAAARNRSFELASGKWVAWIDADDILPGPEEAEKLLKENGRWHPGKDAEVAGLPAVPVGLPPTLEGAIRAISEAQPEIACFYAPYLYRRNADGTAAEWQERERIVRNDGTWRWIGKGHEVLVPKDPFNGGQKLGILSSLLFLHMKEWKDSDYIHSTTRHYNALVKEYEEGDRSSRTCHYLENLCKVCAPWRRGEFLQAAYENSFTPLERCRSLIRAGEYAAEQGFFMDAVEHFAGATALRPDLPDAWLAGACAFEKAEDWPRAAEWFDKGVSRPVNMIESLVNPRDLLIGYPAKAAECYRRAMRHAIFTRNDAGARAAAERRFALLAATARSDAAGPDLDALKYLLAWAENDLGALDQVEKIRSLWDYLVRNEETKKAAELVRLVPHTLDDHPAILDLKAWAEKVDTHLANPGAYAEFYNSPECGAEFDHTLFDRSPLPRVQFLIDWVKREKPNARILEVGSFDGSVGIHVLRQCPDVHYVAIDAMKAALEHFEERAQKEGLADRLACFLGMDLEGAEEIRPWKFDVIVFMEILEHVPDPVASLRNLRAKLRPGGLLFVSTPWGAFDRGRPYNLGSRDPRGHVRAMTAKELHDAVTAAGFRVIEQNGANGASGATLHLVAEVERRVFLPTVNFFVPSALWEWNASKVVNTGMGASEETIVYLANRLTREHAVAVYGPVPEDLPCVAEEVHEGVGYWTRAKVGSAVPGTLIVSRSPSAGQMVDPKGKHDRILWLQDTIYPDLNEDTARDYRKIVVLTEWHKALIGEQVGKEKGRIEIVPNFLLRDHFKQEGAPPREPHHFVYASSPDRGLIRLLKLWPRIRERYPDATLDIFYGWEGCMKLGAGSSSSWAKHYRKVRTDFLGLQWREGVFSRGRVNHVQLAREFQRASAWLYPTAFAETGCLTAAKVRAAGCVPVTTRYAGLAETGECPETVWVDMPGVGVVEDPTGDPAAFEEYAVRFIEGVSRAVETSEVERDFMSQEAIAKFDLESVLPRWIEVIGG
jgi:2-polyprenyl-3-methyl-5-hydroxy-6-metoxy-1,4-benzoquinol methylase/glycosyltransferase involved in cell wall biosynthesis